MKKTEAMSILATSVRPREPKDRARYDEAVKMAIEALKCSETPKSSERAAETAQNTSSCAHENDLVSWKAAIEAINGMIDRFERLLADIRESKVDDSVCGMCEYDGAYMGQSGNWCNECPGFDKDDCFKLSDRCRKRWMGDIVLPSAQPEQRWIPVRERLPENDNEVLITVWDAEDDYVEVYKGFYQGHEWWTQWCHGCSKIKDEPCGENIVIAWMPLPEPYRGGEKE